MTSHIATPHHWQGEFTLNRLLSGLVSGGLLAITQIIVSISFGTLIFAGTLEPFVGRGIGVAVVTSGLVAIAVALFSRMPGPIAITQDNPTLVLAIMASHVASGFSPTTDPATVLATVLVMITCATLLSGLFFWVAGRLRLGQIVRYVPYPVIAGFLAGIGWLLMVGSMEIILNDALTLDRLPTLLTSQAAVLWGPGVVVAVLLFAGSRLIKHTLTLPFILIGVGALFFGGMLVLGVSLEEAAQAGVMFSSTQSITWQPITAALFTSIDWTLILREAHNIPILFAMSLIGFLLNLQGIETGLDTDLDPNRELQTIGGVNILSGLMGGMVGYQAISFTLLNDRVGQRSRMAGLVVGVLCLAFVAFGAATLSYFPRPLIGGILLFIGLDLFIDWGVTSARRLTRPEYAIVLVIVIVIALVDFLIGVVIGLVLMVVLFAVRYSQIEPVRYDLTGHELTSTVTRSAMQQHILTEQGGQIRIVELQGFIFFGTANAILQRVQAHLTDAQTRFILLDFTRVYGMDSSAVHSLAKLGTLARSQGVMLLLAGARTSLKNQLEASGLTADHIRYPRSLDYGLEWCEDRIIEGQVGPEDGSRLSLPGISHQRLEQILTRYMERLELSAGDTLIKQESPARDLFFIASGRVSVVVLDDQGQPLRLSTAGPGSMVGELSLILESERTASVHVDEPTVAFRLTEERLAAMHTEAPELALALHQALNVVLAQRVSRATAAIRGLR